jgi:two-component system, cell cycle sensor histidine kinase and response regulator CckA
MEPTAPRVLLVDDEPALLKLVGSYLTRLGYAVTTASTTEKAWAEVQDSLVANGSGYAVAVLDASMPGLPMPELAERILKASTTMRILAASGYPFDVAPLEQAAPGRVAFLHKPFTPEMLAGAVRRMLAPQEEQAL